MKLTDSETSQRLSPGLLALMSGLGFIALDFAFSGDSYAGWQQYPFGAVIGGMLIAGGCFQIVLRCLHWNVAFGLYIFLFGAWILTNQFRYTEPGEQYSRLGIALGVMYLLSGIYFFFIPRSPKALATERHPQ